MRKKLARENIGRKRQHNKGIWYGIVTLIGVAMLVLILFIFGIFYQKVHGIKEAQSRMLKIDQPDMVIKLLTPNEYSRPQIPLKKVKGVVVHYVANPGTTGWENQHYFESLKETQTTKVSSHFIIGLDGTIIQCIPLDEIAYASNERNVDTISIECCHPKEDGKFTKETYDSLIKLTAWLAGEYNLVKDDIIRHYDVTGKNCPKYFVEHEEEWEKFKETVFAKQENEKKE